MCRLKVGEVVVRAASWPPHCDDVQEGGIYTITQVQGPGVKLSGCRYWWDSKNFKRIGIQPNGERYVKQENYHRL